MRSTGEWLAGTATTTERARAAPATLVSRKSATSRERSPISPITMTSALAARTIMPSSTDLPTPEPAMMPTRWPWPIVSSPLIARTPTSSGTRTRPRSSGDWSLPASGQLPAPRIGPSPSIGLPAPSTTRPSSAAPTSASPGAPVGRTGACGRRGAGPPRFISKRAPITEADHLRLDLVPHAADGADLAD